MASVKDWKTWGFMLVYVLLNGAGTISYFFPTLMTSLGYRGRNAQCEYIPIPLFLSKLRANAGSICGRAVVMTVPIYVVALVVSLGMGWNADRTKQKPWHIIAATVLSTVSFILTVAIGNADVKFAFICFGGAGIWTAVPLFLSWMVGNFEGKEKRAISIAMINGFGTSRLPPCSYSLDHSR